MNDKNKYIVDRGLHWGSSILMLIILMGTWGIFYDVNEPEKVRPDAIQLHFRLVISMLVLLIIRLIYSGIGQKSYSRLQYKSANHGRLVKLVHTIFYLTLFSLAASGMVMLINSADSVELFGITLFDFAEPDRDLFNMAISVHHFLIDAVWWLIVFHIAGAIYSDI
ncbi:hypothetical protein PSECIP111951_00166 [Pseudoalteromonas holothuriae]|uniref:Cytochrome b561 bacterial/Ni-hydrogenase domain-containing protein n=1 Tax=Pseudoalteromonas holothuriae TaxID=2963714 RepID=A0A9W4W1M8_9GAMM|nr:MULTISPECIES: cytochrome b/b6 domain-containing protein [unclassified Pseudoalteromonas]CAH9050309.1 hypothetical protein PSECIP111951_00166 [Pseudoalteromonas sp. CIP111951]CAH9052362.1 hypothetical protein PSECIP111854_00953 [Pseudoalteromonas sp. CIP111854]